MNGGDYLFIGGPKDGKRITTACDPVRVATADSDGSGFATTDYRSLRLRGEQDEHVLFVESSLSPDDMVAALVENYRPADARHVANLVMLVSRLVHQIRRHETNNDVAEKAMNYLRRKDLLPSIVRDVTGSDLVL